MSYTLIAGYGLNDLTMGEFRLAPVDKPINQIAKEYDRFYFTLTVNYSKQKVKLDIKDIPNYQLMSMDIETFLSINGNRTLSVSEFKETEILNYAKYVNISNLDWLIKSHNSDYEISEPLADHLHKDLVISFEDDSLGQDLLDNNLFFVDGCCVRADYARNNLYLLDVRKDDRTRLFDVGSIDFSSLGGIRYVDIHYDNAYNRDMRENSKDVIYIGLDEDIGSGTPFLSLMGFFFIDSSVIQIVGDRTIKLNFFRTEFLEKILYLLGRGQLTPSELGLIDDTAFEVDALNSTRVIETLLNHSSTFMGFINSSDVEVSSIDYKSEHSANVHSTTMKERLPVFYDNGLMFNHLRREAKTFDGVMLSGNRDYLMERSMNHKSRYKEDYLVDSRRMPCKPFRDPTVHGKLIHTVGEKDGS